MENLDWLHNDATLAQYEMSRNLTTMHGQPHPLHPLLAEGRICNERRALMCSLSDYRAPLEPPHPQIEQMSHHAHHDAGAQEVRCIHNI